jgi:hypothetical protein
VRTADTTIKLERIQALRTKKPKSLRSVKHQRKPQTLAARPSMAMTLLSPYRFPIDAEKIALGTARFGGVFFVIVGALFTLIFAEGTFSFQSQLASLATGTSEGVIVQDASFANSTYESKPSVEFIVNNTDVLSGSVQIRVKVQHAEDVTLLGYNKTLNEEVTFGRPEKVSTDTWEITVDTTEYSDGEYKLKALIKDQYGTYEAVDDSYVVVANTHFDTHTTTQLESVTPSRTGESTNTINTTTTANEAEARKADQDKATTTPVIHTEEKRDQTYIAPEIRINIDASSPLSKRVAVQVKVEDAVSVELYALPKNSLVQHYLGMASKVDAAVWNFRWDTTALPNGDYKVIVYAKNAYGTYFDNSDLLTVRNEVQVTYTEEEQKHIAELISIAQNETEIAKPSYLQEEENNTEENAERIEPDSIVMPDENEEKLDTVFDELRGDINEELKRLAFSMRVKDEKAVSDSKERLRKRTAEVTQAYGGSFDEQLLVSRIDAYLDGAIKRIEDDVVRIEKVIKERTAKNEKTDSDGDGVSDYDEIALYSTNPYGADSDGDGFIDGSEILNGYDPTDPSSGVLVAYESPKESGVVRDDILKVDSIITAQKNEGEEATVPKAILTGKGLRNSFVTLYIFSTPIVVTVKTDKDGNWNYRFDRELEDGEHEVYIGITDNAGKLVAKSSPLLFVKEAEAFTAVGAPSQTPDASVSERSILSEYMIYLVLSISVVAIGLVLILLGLYLDTRLRRFGTALENTESAV